MKDEDVIASQWRDLLDRAGIAGRTWRKALIVRLAAEIPTPDLDRAELAALKRAIHDARRARAQMHWRFRPERLRFLLALYLRARAGRRGKPETR